MNPGTIWDPSQVTKPKDYDFLKSRWFQKVPFTVVYKEGRGRFLLASDDMKAGDPVISSFPYCYAVCDDVKESVCQYCFEEILEEESGTKPELPIRCPGCHQVWYCSDKCKKMDEDQHRYECKTMDAFFNNIDWDDPGNRTEIRLFCRTLSRRNLEVDKVKLPENHYYLSHNPVNFEDFMKLISSRDQEQSLLTSLLEIVQYIKGLDSWLSGLEDDLLLDVVLKTRNNMFNIFKSSTVSLGWGVYIEASLFNHSCQPNVCLFRKHVTPEFYFVALHDIPKGCEINVTYLGYGELEARQTHLKEHYFFDCDCIRCKEEKQLTTSPSFTAWHESYHCKKENCLGYIVPWSYDSSPPVPSCNYCSFTPKNEQNVTNEGEPEEQVTDQT